MLGDVDGDGTPDFFGGGKDVLMVWSGADGSVLHELECRTENWDVPSAADLGDVDGDEHDDFVVGDPEASVLAGFGGLALGFVRSGADASVLMALHGASHYGKAASSVATLGDADGDGRPEFLVGQPHHGGFGTGVVFLHEYEPLPLEYLHVAGTDAVSEGFGTIMRAPRAT